MAISRLTDWQWKKMYWNVLESSENWIDQIEIGETRCRGLKVLPGTTDGPFGREQVWGWQGAGLTGKH